MHGDRHLFVDAEVYENWARVVAEGGAHVSFGPFIDIVKTPF